MSTIIKIRYTVGMVAAFLAGLAVMFAALAGGSGQAHSYRTGNCQWNNPTAQVLCVHRADRRMCHDALGGHAPCWAFVGRDTELIWNWDGKVSSS